jgi:alpha-glucosidase
MFGEDILATCIAVPGDEVTGVATIDMWFPEGNDWFDMASGAMFKGGQKRDIGYTIDDNPWYVKAGSVIPMNPAHVRSLKTACDTLVLTAIPGADGQLSYYEDDGVSPNYKTDYTITKVEQKRSENGVVLTVAPREGKYAGMKDTRSYELRFMCTRTPEKVLVNGVEIPYDRYAKAGQWTYDAYNLAPVVYLKDMPVNETLTVELVLPAGRSDADLYALKGIFSRCKNISEPYKNEQGLKDRRKMLPIEYLKVSQCPNFIMADPQNIFKYVDDLKENLPMFEKYLEGETPLISDGFKARLKAHVVDGYNANLK